MQRAAETQAEPGGQALQGPPHAATLLGSWFSAQVGSLHVSQQAAGSVVSTSSFQDKEGPELLESLIGAQTLDPFSEKLVPTASGWRWSPSH